MSDPSTSIPCSPPHSATRVRYVVLLWLCAAAVIAYIPRSALGQAQETIRTDLGLQEKTFLGILRLTPEQQMGWVMSAFFITYAVFQLPAGWLGHVWGNRRALCVFALLWSAATGLFALARGSADLFLARLGMGAAQAGMFACTARTTAQWFPRTGRALPSGAMGSMMSVGAAVAAYLTFVFLGWSLDWRWMFALYAVPGVAWGVAFYVWFRDNPEEHPAVNAAELERIRGTAADPAALPAAGASEPTPWRAILTSRAMWWISGQQFFRAAGYIFYATWFATFLRQTRNISETEAAYYNMFPFWGVVLGGLTGGLLSDWLLTRTGSRRLSRQGQAVVSLLAAASLLVLAYSVADVRLLVLLVTASSFCAALAGSCSYVITIDLGGKYVAPVFSVMNMAGNVGAILFPVAVPELARLADWGAVLLLVAAIYGAAVVCWLLLDPTEAIPTRPAPKQNGLDT